MVFINIFEFILFLTCLPPVVSFWFFSCRHGNGYGDVGDPCWALCQCRAPNTCEAGVQRCVSPGKLNDHCHLTRPCGRGLSCHPGIQKCYHVPRRLYEPCVAGYECGSGLSCQPGIQVCFHASRRYNEPCVGGYSCGPGLSCQPGAQRCLHFPRLENERCSLGFECAAGLECTLCAEPYLTCQLGRVPDQEDEFYRRPYNRVAFLVTHNSFSNSVQYAVWVRNQRVSVAQQLKDGVRGLMLDIYPGWGKAEVRLCHAVCFWGGSTDLLDTLMQIRDFLETNPREVITIIFEDYLRNPTILKRVFDQARVSNHVLRSEHWGTLFRDWPTLEEMRTLGRLVVFNNNGLQGFPYTVYNMWYYVRENRYGHPGQDTKTCVDRAESQYNAHNDNWSLVLVNWFGTIPNPLDPCLNPFPKLQDKLTTCQRSFGQLPNFLAVDFYHDGEKGGAFKAVEWLNKQWKAQFPTANKSFAENFKNDKYVQNMKSSIENYWNQIMTGINETETKDKNITTRINHVIRGTDHVINTTNHIMNMTHVVNASNQSSRGKIQGVNMTGHVINMTSHVIGNSTQPPVTMEIPTVGLDNTNNKMDSDYRRSKQKQLNSTSIGVDIFNNSNSDETFLENTTKMNDNTNAWASNMSGLDSKLLRYNTTSYMSNNEAGNKKMSTLNMKLDSAANKSKIGKDFEEGMFVDNVLNGSEGGTDANRVSNDNEGPQLDPSMPTNTAESLQLRKNTNVTQSERFLNGSNILSTNSRNASQGNIFLNSTKFDAINVDQMLRTKSLSSSQTVSKNKLLKLFNFFSPARNLTMNNTETINNNETTGIGKGMAEKQAKPFWNLPRNNGNKPELLEEIINDIR